MTLDFSFLAQYWPALLQGAIATIVLTSMTVSIALPAASILAVIKLSAPDWLRTLIDLYVEVIRNTPILVQLFLIFFGLPTLGIRVSPNVAALVGLSVYGTAYLLEVIRSGLLSVPRGQTEAARALGLNGFDVFRYVIFIPAFRTIYPALTSQFIMLLLTSSVVTAISAGELTHEAHLIQSITFKSFEVYTVVAVIYFVMGMGFIGLFRFIHGLIFSYPLAK